tara:strand:+ start:586 stop:1551 length:966 start_codon:yes stop_codon:yes gene_type:complete
MNFNYNNVTPIKGDASFRKFYRKKNKNRTSILVFSEKEKEKNLLIYDAINKLLLKNRIKAPKLLSHNYNENYIEIQDFGKLTIYSILRNKKINKFKLFKKIILLLNKIQKINNNKIKNFKNKNYKLPIYSKKILFNEAELFLKWYVPKMLIKKKASALNKKLTSEINLLLLKLKLKNNTFVHRDFHVSNLMKIKKQIGILDSQDALIGNEAYDLASLIDDVRLKTSSKLKNSIYDYYIYLNKKKINKNYFSNDFEILSVLRNLKIIGIFTRLAIRDKKKKYLKLIPYAWKLIENRINNNIIFANLKNYLDDNFSMKTRMKK